MCGRYTLATPDPADIRARFPVGESVEIRQRYDVASGDDEHKIRSCAILTVPANSAIAPLHDRMPVILEPEHEAAWLDASTPREHLKEVAAGLPPSDVALREVGLAVNDARYDGPDCLDGPVHPAQAALF